MTLRYRRSRRDGPRLGRDGCILLQRIVRVRTEWQVLNCVRQRGRFALLCGSLYRGERVDLMPSSGMTRRVAVQIPIKSLGIMRHDASCS